ncbi:hypothetical protein RND81_14G197000 [Saponaria officinalis]|uniref:Uncharacterized protein n=1 Tax=Saponaria officinalis TaxID=3572 RepID=A0AAW1GRU3_SAPOF
MAVEGNQQADMTELGSVVERIDGATGAIQAVSGLETGVVVKQNQETIASELNSVLASGVCSRLGCGEKLSDDSERKYENSDFAKSVMKGSQQIDVSGLNSFLASTESLNDDSRVRNNDVGEDALWFDASEILLPMNAEDGDAGFVRDDAMDDDNDAINVNSSYDLLKCAPSVDEIVLPAKKGELRERKKSKYLSPPYVNLKNLPRGMKSPGVEKSAFFRSGSVKRRKKWQETSASSRELLWELRLAALDCRYAWENNNQFDTTEIFFTMFRSSVFHDEKELVEDAFTENAPVMGDNDQNLQTGSPSNSENKPKKRKSKKKTDNRSMNMLPTALYDVNVNVASTLSSLYLSQGNKDNNSSFERKEAVGKPDLNYKSPDTTSLEKRGRKKRTVLANLNPDGNPETKKRRKQKDSTLSSSTTENAKPISLEVCLPNVGPNPSHQLNAVDNNLKADKTQPVTASEPAGEAPTLSQVRQKLEFITTMLDKAGDDVSFEMKVTLENEIRELLKKVSTMPS